ncbi:hypothetical protein BL254_21960 [Protofrankia sp. BMG5.30]|uniref:MOSC domain-containing protein n=2 Tax=Protofrankia coriariae TaxID=1562887 RepID=A0ABR5EYX0_9ACTN|nr:hypothetical protein FrCorBMG51_23460 [Protofrankia coriariae]ONH32336.1 hypothetical protein BL254_21960 [Protofrankia sp. BMG5.30]
MWEGSVVSLHVAPAHGAPMTEVGEVLAVAGRGLMGDRYFRYFHDGAAGGPSRHVIGRSSGVCEISFIDVDALTALKHDHGVFLASGEARRNVVCRGVPLDQLVGQELTVGADVRVRGTALSEPCARLERLTRPGVLRGLLHRGGLRAMIVSGGVLRIGDPVRLGRL